MNKQNKIIYAINYSKFDNNYIYLKGGENHKLKLEAEIAKRKKLPQQNNALFHSASNVNNNTVPECRCGNFTWLNEQNKKPKKFLSTNSDIIRLRKQLEEVQRTKDNKIRALNIQFETRNPQFIVGKKLGSGAQAIANELAYRSKPNNPCFILHIREPSKVQPGGIHAFNLASKVDAAPKIIFQYVDNYQGNKFQYTVMERLSRIVDLEEFNNTKEGQHMQQKIIDAAIKLGNALVIHGDEDTPGNIMYCAKKDQVFFIDFNDKNWLGNPTTLDKYDDNVLINKEKREELWGGYEPGISAMINKWKNKNELPPYNIVISIMSLLRIIVGYSSTYYKPLTVHNLPTLIINKVIELSKNNLCKEDVLMLLRETIGF